MQSIDPTTGLPYLDHALHSPSEVDRRIALAVTAQAAWRATPIADRAASLVAIADALEAGVDEHAGPMTREMGKPIAESEGELRKCAWVCRYYAEHGARFLAPEAADVGSTDAYVRFDPVGVVLAVMPWNFPWWQVLRFAAPALMAGNAMLMKHAPNSQDCASRIESLMSAAGLPPGLLQRLVIDVDAVPEIIGRPEIAAVTLTGSDRAGRAVGALAGAHLKKSVLELGGSDPFIVLADADIAAAVAEGVRSRCLNNGQSCIAAKRFLVEEPVLEEFTERMTASMRALVLGDPSDRGTDLGPLAREDLRASLHSQVARAMNAARVRLGGAIPPGPGWFYPATVLDRVTPGSSVWDQETFGPVAAICGVRDADEAIDLANASRFGLGASLWTADHDRAHAIAARLDVGCIFVNRMTASDPRVPFGGTKESGYGRELGRYGIREFVNIKTVVIA